MIIADLYVRVSTDEQADKGYSLRHQEDILRKYCELKGYQVRGVVHEDHSAKNFERPQFQRLLMNYRKEKGIVNLFLFTKWDRFSRNAPEAYMMIKTLNKLGIEPFAIEQPLDLSVPENKIMLAFYLASPEVENDRRSLNVTVGMRKALKEGRYMGKAPIGYINKRIDNNKWIEPDPATCDLVVSIFEDAASGKYSAESILKFARARGLSSSKNNFWNILRNPVYCGKILVPAYKGEEQAFVASQHKALISESLFLRVQNVLDGNKKVQKAKRKTDDRFPLRGYILCSASNCNKQLTASASRGRKQYYDYYHCTTQCGTRYPAGLINSSISNELSKWQPHPAVKVLYRYILEDIQLQQEAQEKLELKSIKDELAVVHSRHAKARELLLSDSFDPDDYRVIKKECDAKSMQLELRIVELTTNQAAAVGPDIENGISVLETLAADYMATDLESKRAIIDSIFPEKLIFDGNGFRTARVNEAVQLIFNLSKAFGEIKKGQSELESALSHEVIPLVPFSNHFLYDLRKLAALKHILKAS